MCCENYPEETCGLLYAKTPFQITEKWFVFFVENIAINKKTNWHPHPDELIRVKREAKKQGLTRIGNIHSHPIPQDYKEIFGSLEKAIEHANCPSDDDLKYAKRYNDIVRGTLVVDDKAVFAHCFHDQFGVPLPDLYLNGVNHREVILEVREGFYDL